jgi:hypothetical protein
MTHEQRQALSAAEALHRASMGLHAINRVLRENLDGVDLPGGCALSICDQYGLLLAAEHLANHLYVHIEGQLVDLQGPEQEAAQ